MTRMVRITSAIAVFIAIIYVVAWAQVYRMSQRYYAQAEVNLKVGNYALAIKGTPSVNGETDYQGGLEQVVNMWSNAWARPRPSVYGQADTQLNTLIQTKLSSQDVQNIFQTYLGLDNQYLAQIMLASADRSAKHGDIAGAKQDYNTVIEVFTNDSVDIHLAKARLAMLK